MQSLEDLCKVALEGYKMLKEKSPESLGNIGLSIVENRIYELKMLILKEMKTK
jgi:hypothetical protein